jgi:hypothetical protein
VDSRITDISLTVIRTPKLPRGPGLFIAPIIWMSGFACYNVGWIGDFAGPNHDPSSVRIKAFAINILLIVMIQSAFWIIYRKNMLMKEFLSLVPLPCLAAVALTNCVIYVCILGIGSLLRLASINLMVLIGLVVIHLLGWMRDNQRWRIEKDGVIYETKIGRSCKLRWSDVDRIQWGKSLKLEGKDQIIVIPFWNLERDLREEVKKQCSNYLCEWFDLTPEPDIITCITNVPLRFALAKVLEIVHFVILVAVHVPNFL